MGDLAKDKMMGNDLFVAASREGQLPPSHTTVQYQNLLRVLARSFRRR